MLFNSYLFILLFLPVTLLVFFAIGGLGRHRIAIAWLVGASLFFYGWWNPAYLGLILASIFVNYAIGVALTNHTKDGSIHKRAILIAGIAFNLMLLGYFKYANFFVNNVNVVFDSNIELAQIILPLAISFFTFQQVTYLIDAYYGLTREYNFLHYCLFVTFFPQLIAGPIVHHKEMLPQFSKESIYRVNYGDLSIGITIFLIGLFKKVIIADNVALYSTPVFDAAEQGILITFLEAWTGSLAYTFQLYFDFSGYSDMAIGLARMFGIKLPLNFSSPYKANNIIEFWRRWHMTLSRFLRDYLYIPLGGSKKGNYRRYVNLFITMLLGGLWHGAGWTFVLWGALHGLYLTINHAWRWFFKILGCSFNGLIYSVFSRLVTFLAVIVGWVFFRAESIDAATNILRGMIGMNGLQLTSHWVKALGINPSYLNDLNITIGSTLVAGKSSALLIAFLMIIVWVMPNTQQFMCRHEPALETYPDEIKPAKLSYIQWSANRIWMLIIAIMGIYTILNLTKVSEFLYFQF